MDVIGIGTPCADFLVNLQELPLTNQNRRIEEYSWQCGGKVATALAALARLGAETGVIGVVGSCALGRFCVEDFRRHGVDTSRLIVDEGKETSFSLVISEKKTGGRNIIYHPGDNRTLAVSDLSRDYIESGEFLHLEAATPVTETAAQWAREAGAKVVFDGDGFHKKTVEMFPLIDVFIGSGFFYQGYAGGDSLEQACQRIRETGPQIAVFTLGERGCAGLDGEEYFEEPGFKVDAVDTTGAGDVFHGAFIYGLLKGWKIRETARFANAAAAVKCTCIGGRAGIPDLEAVEKFLKSGAIDDAWREERINMYRRMPG